MKELWANKEVRRLLLYRFLEVGVVIVIIALCVWGYNKTRQTQRAAATEQARLAMRPQYLVRLSTVQQELRGRTPDLDRILQLIKSSQEIVGFIEELEETAKDYKVILEVPDIAEVQRLDEAGVPVVEGGPFRSISLTISAQGRAEDLLQYIHDVEHAPHLVSLRDWNITVDSVTESSVSSGLGAREVGSAGSTPAPRKTSQLDAELILVVHNEKYSP